MVKSSGQPKRKVVENSKEHDEQSGAKPRQHQKKTEECKSALLENGHGVKPSRAAKSSVKKVLQGGDSLRKTTRISEPKLQNGESLSSAKIKLQLFPVSETIRLRLEKDGHNPFLELTLSARKKISSVIKHLNTKWGSSSAALGKLILFPYNTMLENIASCRRWASDTSCITAGELHEILGSPPIFRLRYGWFCSLDMEASGISCASVAMEAHSESGEIGRASKFFSRIMGDQTEALKVVSEEIRNPTDAHEAADITEQMPLAVPADHAGDNVINNSVLASSIVPWDDGLSLSLGGLLDDINISKMKSMSQSGVLPLLDSDISIGGLLCEASLLNKISNPKLKSEDDSGMQRTEPVTEISRGGLLSEASFQNKIDSPDLMTENEAGLQPRKGKGVSQSQRDNCLMLLSIGGSSEASLQGRISSCNPKSEGSTSNSKSRIPTFDSFDAFLAAQPNSHPQIPKPLLHDSGSSILDAEETCHPFARFPPTSRDSITLNRRENSNGVSTSPQTDKKSRTNSSTHLVGVYNDESSLGIRGFKWNDSRGPFDLGLPMLPQVNDGDSASRFVW